MSRDLWYLVFTAIIIIALLWYMYKPLTEGFDQPFSLITEDISYGNPISTSGRQNRYININQLSHPTIIYQGQGIPLLHEDHPTAPIPVKDQMFYFQDYSCRPECCRYSSNSCSNGCVCWNAPPQKGVEQNSAISPRS